MMVETNLDGWNRYLLGGDRGDYESYEWPDREDKYQNYRWPDQESTSDVLVKMQDSGKRAREKQVILKALDFDWNVALDFGCGQGANFCLFSGVRSKYSNRLLIAVDPDPARIAEAEDAASVDLQGIDYVLGCYNISEIEQAPAELYFDAILCSQVLGHLAIPEADRVVRELCRRVRRRGRAVLLYPVYFPSALNMPFARKHTGDDLLHEVDTTLTPQSPGYRTLLTPGEFNCRAKRPTNGRLPLRSFSLAQIGPTDQSKLPLPIDELPPSIGNALPGSFTAVTEIYSIHEYDTQSGLPAIADAVTTFFLC